MSERYKNATARQLEEWEYDWNRFQGDGHMLRAMYRIAFGLVDADNDEDLHRIYEDERKKDPRLKDSPPWRK